MTRFETLFSLEVEHDHYAGECEDIGWVVPGDVARLMQGAGLTAKPIGGALRVFFRADATGAPIRPLAAASVRIGLAVRDSRLATVTEGFDLTTGRLYYRNGERSAALDPPTRVEIVGRSLSWQLTRTERPLRVTLADAAGRAFREESVVVGDPRTGLGFNLTGVKPGRISLEETHAASEAAGIVRSTYYLDPELWRRGVFALVEIAIDHSFLGNPPRLRVVFGARLDTLRYYVVARGFSSTDADQFAVRDQASGDAAVQFERVLPAQLSADERLRSDLLAEDGARVLLFRSSSAVARRQIGRKRIQLMRNNEALFENLPQPGRARETADLIVHLSKSKA